MRPLVAFLILLACCAGAHAQQQEQKLIDRIMKPNNDLGSSFQNVSFYTGKGGFDTASTAYVKDYNYVQKFSAKDFTTKEYSAKDYWQGDFVFATKTAETKTNEAAGKLFATKSAEVKDARESGKNYEVKDFSESTKTAVPAGKISQQHLNDLYLGKKPMSMDDVRHLLNKYKPASQSSQ